jgi:hypothetical protein
MYKIEMLFSPKYVYKTLEKKEIILIKYILTDIFGL